MLYIVFLHIFLQTLLGKCNAPPRIKQFDILFFYFAYKLYFNNLTFASVALTFVGVAKAMLTK